MNAAFSVVNVILSRKLHKIVLQSIQPISLVTRETVFQIFFAHCKARLCKEKLAAEAKIVEVRLKLAFSVSVA